MSNNNHTNIGTQINTPMRMGLSTLERKKNIDKRGIIFAQHAEQQNLKRTFPQLNRKTFLTKPTRFKIVYEMYLQEKIVEENKTLSTNQKSKI